MATQSPKTRKTKTTKKTALKAKTPAKKPVKAAAKPTRKVAAPARSARFSRVKVSRVFRRRQRGASINTAKNSRAASLSLYAWNRWMAALFALQGVGILLAGKAHSLPVVGHYLALDTFASQGQDEVRVPAQQHLFDVNLVYWLAGISFVFALGHLLAATALRSRYDAQVDAGSSKLRWTTYIFGYGGLAVLFALLVGLNDVVGLALLVFLTVVWSVMALGAERFRQAAGLMRGLAAAAFLGLWVVLAYSLLNAWLYGGSIPVYEYVLVGVSFLLSLQLGLVFMSQQKGNGKWADYANAERAYMLWTFVLVATVTWQVFFGALQP